MFLSDIYFLYMLLITFISVVMANILTQKMHSTSIFVQKAEELFINVVDCEPFWKTKIYHLSPMYLHSDRLSPTQNLHLL